MARIRYVGESRYRSTDTGDMEPGDVADVSDPSHWADRDDFEIVESDGEEDTDDGETFYCVGKDGECSREVDVEGGRCWQHPEDDD